MKVRQTAYQMVARHGIEKDDPDMDKVGRLMAMMRRDINFHRHYPHLKLALEAIVDGSSEMHNTYTEESVSEALLNTANGYRRSVMAEADTFVLFLMEKDGLIATVSRITDEYDVPILAQPFTSISHQFAAAKMILAALNEGKNAVVYHLGDYDPSGKTMFTSLCSTDTGLPHLLVDHLGCPFKWVLGSPEWLESATATYKPAKDAACIRWSDFCDPKQKVIRWASPRLTIERLGLIRSTVDQHCAYGIRLTKRKGNTHAQRFPDDDSCELDALPPAVLRNMVRRAIERHIPKSLVTKVRARQAKEQKVLERLARQHR
jgi:hypothetical protein